MLLMALSPHSSLFDLFYESLGVLEVRWNGDLFVALPTRNILRDRPQLFIAIAEDQSSGHHFRLINRHHEGISRLSRGFLSVHWKRPATAGRIQRTKA